MEQQETQQQLVFVPTQQWIRGGLQFESLQHWFSCTYSYLLTKHWTDPFPEHWSIVSMESEPGVHVVS